MKFKNGFVLAMIMCILLSHFSAYASEEKAHLKYVREPVRYSPEWGSQTVVYIATPKLEEYFRTYVFHGMVYQCT